MTDLIDRLVQEAISLCQPEDACKKSQAYTRKILRKRFKAVLGDLKNKDWTSAKVSIDMDTHFDGDGLRVYGRVVDWQAEDYDTSGKGIGLRLLCEYESDNFDMTRQSVGRSK